ncbi:MAG: TusE/DsrC/DsvC family sulfur relay protein [Gammaproteobacteria bacterium]|jgi:tRNA 2-thiouridine synthesizing protein E
MPQPLEAPRDPEGYIVDPEDWTEALATQLAAEEGLELDDQYWAVIHFMRQYWGEHHVAPDVRHVIQYLTATRQLDKKQAKQQLFKLFPYGYVRQACKIAGMQRPRVWSTG